MKDLSCLSAEEMTTINYKCSCGRNHSVEIKNIIVGAGVITKVSNVIKGYEGKKVFIVEDLHTYEVAGKKVEELLINKFQVSKYIFKQEH
ncbi:MAG: hypothetical protein ACREVX_01265 [Clostridium sp.]|uniref:hypothetical protein n=1 Tax=Clostridium sp. TaxID=1506 RepID=UPI003D6CFAC4